MKLIIITLLALNSLLQAAQRPNILFLFSDDQRADTLSALGNAHIHTPTLDRLAAGGLRYTNFHTTALCSPTRACLLTGRNHHSVGMGMLASWDSGFPGLRGLRRRPVGALRSRA